MSRYYIHGARRCGRTARRHHPVKAMIAFRPIRQIFEQLATDGDFAYEGKVPVIKDETGAWCEFMPALLTWCDCWDRIAQGLAIKLTTTAIRRIAAALEAEQTIDESALAAAIAEIDLQYRAYLTRPADDLDHYVKTARIRVALEDAGALGAES
jgi:hypothetical protein